jgi:hypothetical protein
MRGMIDLEMMTGNNKDFKGFKDCKVFEFCPQISQIDTDFYCRGIRSLRTLRMHREIQNSEFKIQNYYKEWQQRHI